MIAMSTETGLERHGIAPSGDVLRNPTTSQLYTDALRRGDGRLAEGGPLVVDTGRFTGRSPQDKFVVREAGNIASSPTNLGSLEFGQAVLGSKLILVLGHSSCGAVRAALEGAKPGGNIQSIVDAIAPSIAGSKTLEEATIANVRGVQKNIREKSPLLQKAEAEGKIRIAGAVYDLGTGIVTFLPA